MKAIYQIMRALQAEKNFQLTAPEGEDSDEDSLGDQTTNDSIEIEIVEAVASTMQEFDRGAVKFVNHPKPVFVWNGENWEKKLI